MNLQGSEIQYSGRVSTSFLKPVKTYEDTMDMRQTITVAKYILFRCVFHINKLSDHVNILIR